MSNDGAALREARKGRNAGVEPIAAKDEAKRALDGRPDGPFAKPAHLKCKGWTQKKPPRGSRAAGEVAQTLDTRRI
jgi:hypothetical protein